MDSLCTDDHSSGMHCPEHGYDGSVPAPQGFAWHDVQRADGQIYTSMVRGVDSTLELDRLT